MLSIFKWIFLSIQMKLQDFMQIFSLCSSKSKVEMLFSVIFDFVKKQLSFLFNELNFSFSFFSHSELEKSVFVHQYVQKLSPLSWKLFTQEISFENHRRTLKTLKVVKIVFISIIINN